MNTFAQIAALEKLQALFSALAVFDISGNMFSGEPNFAECNTTVYDYIVIGGGSAGAVLGARLVEANFKTLIIEAGGNPGLETQYPGFVTAMKNSNADWNFTAENQGIGGTCQKSTTLLPSGRVLGGSGATNFMFSGRGFPSDYEKISKTAKDSSFNWKNMLKYFKMSQKLETPSLLKSKYGKYHSADGKICATKQKDPIFKKYLRGFKQAGEHVVVDNIGAGILGYSTALLHICDGTRTEAACSYLSPLKNNTNLYITRHSLATKIIFDKNKNAVGVEFLKDGKTITVKARKEIIVTAGPIKSPQLLMLSGIGPKEELKKFNISVVSNLPVGKNLQNNIGTLLVFGTNRAAEPDMPIDVHDFPSKLIVGHSALNKSSNIPAYTTVNHIINNYGFFRELCGFTVGIRNEVCDKLCSLSKQRQLFVAIILNPYPKSRGRIQLKSTDPRDQPRINNRYFTNRDDLEAVVDYIMDYMKIESAPFFKSIGLKFLRGAEKCDKYKYGSRPFWRCHVLCMTAGLSNKCGTCAIGSVVDSKFKVIGVNGLRVVDASVPPNTIGGPIFDPVVAFAEKAAEIITKKM